MLSIWLLSACDTSRYSSVR